MKLPVFILRRLHWINLPGAILIALLQRTPVLRVMSTVGEIIQAAPAGNVLRGAVAVSASLGAMHSLAGATQFVQNPSGVINGTVGQSLSVSFTINGSPEPPTFFTLDSALPPGLTTIPVAQNGRINSRTPIITGAPTQGGTFRVDVTGSDGIYTETDSIIFIIAGGNTAPVITTQPTNQTVTAGGTATFTAAATGSPTPTFQWRKDGTAIVGATGTTLTLTNVAVSAAGTYSVVATNSVNTATSSNATLTVNAAATAPVITTQPTSQSAAVGGTATFTAAASGSPAPTYQWSKNGTAITGATGATLTLSNVQTGDAGNYQVAATNSVTTVTSAIATLTVSATSTAPVIASKPPASIALVAGQSLVINVGATGTGLTYQWSRILAGTVSGGSGTPIAGATDATYSIRSLTVADAGIYICTVTNGVGSAGASTSVTVAAAASANPGRLINLSVFTGLTTAREAFSLGYVVNGANDANKKPLVIRAVGPSLSVFGVANTLADPKLELFAGSTKTTENDDWGGAQTIADAMVAVGAFAFTGPASKDAALATSVASRDNSVQVSAGASAPNGTGAVIAEVYDASTSFNAATTAKLINVSVRKDVGELLTMGFVISGDTGKTVLVRAIGPTLTVFGVGGAMADPKLELFDGGGKSIATNDNWGGSATLATAFTDTGAFGLGATSKDASILATLPPGNYTAQVKVASGVTGTALVEVYEAP